jgi:hypothetical protein
MVWQQCLNTRLTPKATHGRRSGNGSSHRGEDMRAKRCVSDHKYEVLRCGANRYFRNWLLGDACEEAARLA